MLLSNASGDQLSRINDPLQVASLLTTAASSADKSSQAWIGAKPAYQLVYYKMRNQSLITLVGRGARGGCVT